jgi:hypothetical protein
MLFCGLINAAISFGTITEEEITVERKGVALAQKGDSWFSPPRQQVYATNGKIFKDTLSLLPLKLKSGAIAKEMQVGEKYIVRSNGVDFLWEHKNILEITPVR